MLHERRAISDEPKPLHHDFTAYDTPGQANRQIFWPFKNAIRSRSHA